MLKRGLLFLFAWVVLGACQTNAEVTPSSIPTQGSTPAQTTATAPPESPELPASTPSLVLPTATVEGITPDIRMQEDFAGEESCMETFEDVESSAFLFEGQMILDAVSPETMVFSTCQSLIAGDFILEADARVLAAPEDAPYYYGLVFRVSGNERYSFVFGSVGGYCAFYANEIGLLYLTNSTDFVTECWALPPVDVISGDSNRLRVLAVDDRLDFFINGVLMGVVRDNRLTEGLVGFVVTSGAEGGVRVAFDNLRVLKP